MVMWCQTNQSLYFGNQTADKNYLYILKYMLKKTSFAT